MQAFFWMFPCLMYIFKEGFHVEVSAYTNMFEYN